MNLGGSEGSSRRPGCQRETAKAKRMGATDQARWAFSSCRGLLASPDVRGSGSRSFSLRASSRCLDSERPSSMRGGDPDSGPDFPFFADSRWVLGKYARQPRRAVPAYRVGASIAPASTEPFISGRARSSDALVPPSEFGSLSGALAASHTRYTDHARKRTRGSVPRGNRCVRVAERGGVAGQRYAASPVPGYRARLSGGCSLGSAISPARVSGSGASGSTSNETVNALNSRRQVAECSCYDGQAQG